MEVRLSIWTNQNDIATGADLPNGITSSICLVGFQEPHRIRQLFPGGDGASYFGVTLAANEGLAVTLSFDAVDDFDLGLWDSPQHNIVVTSYTSNNPEYVTTVILLEPMLKQYILKSTFLMWQFC